RHHLRRHLSNPKSSVVFVGFAAKGTLARKIIEGQPEIHILGVRVPVRAKIYTINGFSAHADQTELVAWHAKTSAATTYLVHGEELAMGALAPLLRDTRVARPKLNEEFEL
ncbi:MAG TPA: MBL fold metallo-hydrolase, partial [Planctomycetaceae bacterium]|nr:MBL fold metallo-hydrolase [Planctomycetaceae bacterium]